MKYKKGYKIIVQETFGFRLEHHPDRDIELLDFHGHRVLHFSKGGVLTIFAGYACDGPSGPTIPTKNFIVPATVHDALYQFQREGLLDSKVWRLWSDQIIRRLCKDRKMWVCRRWWIFKGLRLPLGHWGAAGAASPTGVRPILYAP